MKIIQFGNEKYPLTCVSKDKVEDMFNVRERRHTYKPMVVFRATHKDRTSIYICYLNKDSEHMLVEKHLPIIIYSYFQNVDFVGIHNGAIPAFFIDMFKQHASVYIEDLIIGVEASLLFSIVHPLKDHLNPKYSCLLSEGLHELLTPPSDTDKEQYDYSVDVHFFYAKIQVVVLSTFSIKPGRPKLMKGCSHIFGVSCKVYEEDEESEIQKE